MLAVAPLTYTAIFLVTAFISMRKRDFQRHATETRTMDASRRTFLKTTAAAGGALAAGLAGNRPLAGADSTAATPGDPSNPTLPPPPAPPQPQDPRPGRHQLHRPPSGRVRPVARPRSHPLQPGPHQHAPLPGSREAGRRPQRRPDRPAGSQLGRGDRQFGHQPALGRTQRRSAQGHLRALHLRLHTVGVRRHQPGPHDHCRARLDV